MTMKFWYALLALLSCAFCFSLLKPAKAHASNAAPLTQAKGGAVRDKATSKTSQADIDFIRSSYTPEQRRSLETVGRQVQSLERKASEAIAEGRYSEALLIFSQERHLLKDHGFRFAAYHPNELECQFQVGNYEKVIEISDQYGAQSARDAGAIGISLIRLGDARRAAAQYEPSKMISRYMRNLDMSRFAPRSSTTRELESNFRLARGMEWFYEANFKAALPELKAADALQPKQPVFSYYLGSTLNRLGRTTQAVTYAPAAERLGGPYIEQARAFSSTSGIGIPKSIKP